MIEPLSTNTQAILLLTAPLVAGRSQSTANLLSLQEYNQLARVLRENDKTPADLIGPNAARVLDLCAPQFASGRLETLLGRGFLLAQAVDRWNTRTIWVVSRADPQYPKRWKGRLRENAPPLLYGCGDSGLLGKGGLAITGSCNAADEMIRYAEKAGRLCAQAHRAVVSGGAQAIDGAALHGCLSGGGSAVAVLPDSLEQAALSRENRQPLKAKRLVLVSPFDPSAEPDGDRALERNKLIYALADAALIVTSDLEQGGTWSGAIEQLDHLQFVPVFVASGAKTGKGNAALLRRGGRAWPDPQNGRELEAAILAGLETPFEAKQDSFPMIARENK